TVSPMLLERYMSVARQISRLAVGDPTIRPTISTYDVPKYRLQEDRASEDLPFWSRSGIAVRHNFPLDGEYLLKIRLKKNSNGSIIGLNEPHQLDVQLDEERIKLFTVGVPSKPVGPQEELKLEEGVESALEVRFATKAGTHLVGVTFLDEGSIPEGMFK